MLAMFIFLVIVLALTTLALAFIVLFHYEIAEFLKAKTKQIRTITEIIQKEKENEHSV